MSDRLSIGLHTEDFQTTCSNKSFRWTSHIYWFKFLRRMVLSGQMIKKNAQLLQAMTWILTHWGRVTHICVSKLTIIGSDNSLSPGRRQAIIWTNDGILLIGPLGTNFSEILSEIHTFSFKKMHLKTSSAKWRPFCFGLNVLKGGHAIS